MQFAGVSSSADGAGVAGISRDGPMGASPASANRPPLLCAHCGTPVDAAIAALQPRAVICDAAAPAPARDAAPTLVFCCNGCAVVYAAIAEFGLERYYALSDKRTPAQPSAQRYAEFDDPVFYSHHVARDSQGRARASFYLEDLRCVGCMWLVESTPQCLGGVLEITVDFAGARADVVFDPATVKLSAIATHLDRLGHPVHPFRGLDREAQRRREDRAMLLRLGVAGAAVGNIMLLAAALYAGMFGQMATRDITFFRWASMVVAVPTLTFAAMPFFRAALASMRGRRLHLDLPLSIGIVAGLGWGAINVLRGVGEIYFDSLAMLVFLLLLSRWLVARQQRRASMAGELLHALAPRRAHRVVAPCERAALPAAATIEVPIEAVGVGDVVLVKPGEVIAVDGVVIWGQSMLDCAVLSGESALREAKPGDAVAAGTTNTAQPLWIAAQAIGEATRLGRLAQFVDEVSRRKAPIERMADRMTGRFVVVVLTVAVLTLVGWGTLSSWGAGLEHTMALLVVTCPCALMLATPVAMAIALSRAAQKGILIKGADAIERLATPGVLFLDKTGTITAGRSAVTFWRGADQFRSLVAAVEKCSAHPIAKAIAGSLATVDAPSLVATDIHEEFGYGISATVRPAATQRSAAPGDDVAPRLIVDEPAGAMVVHVGSPAWILALVAKHPQAARIANELPARDLAAGLAEIRAAGASPVLVTVAHRVVALLGLTDQIRPATRTTVAALQRRGWRVELLSGDEPAAVAAVAAAVGADAAHAEASPEKKLAMVQQALTTSTTVFVGDGVNDAAALSAATCGIAVSGSAEVSMEAAGVFLSKPGIAQVALVLDGASRTIVTIKRNFRISLFYNVAAGALAISGIIHPIIAALFMPLASLSVVTSSMISKAFKDPT